ncbi:long-chain-fatty-acid--CoA ligase [Noviherbaspirillum sedimenti]|uniref:Long-chain-fatty-acid--CoA ligase n=1 Tax=Noviherbaspirillum sedimenti TaxID=2320865 RepID=A0A3A3G410_9BURK|nr:long-chain-fatty-acid--CoA ligase [Noviherbaspirillum sedimenti]RJG03233.1 long-chain-fatty-acid--CoA ligase [Noviherbaspirillum sedimenti]
MSSSEKQIHNIEQMSWLADYPAIGAQRFSDKAAIISDNGSYTYRELDEACDRFAAFLKQQGFTPGTRIAYLGKNSHLFFPVLFGCLRSGVVLVPINWRCTGTEIGYILQNSTSALLIHDQEFSEATREATEKAGTSIATLPTSGDAARTLDRILNDASIPARKSNELYLDECALQMYTSGTTGQPKGVMLSQRALSIARHIELDTPAWDDWTSDDIILSAMPNFHVGGLTWMLIGLLRSLTCILTADPSPANLLRLSQQQHVTRTFMVPTAISSLLDLIKKSHLPAPQLKSIFYGASTMDVHLLKECIETFGCGFGQYFGMTENCGSVTFLPPVSHDIARPELLRSVGKALPGMSIEIRDDNCVPLPANTPGEIWVKSPCIMIGYWKHAEATAEVLVDGWYKTGDGGYLDAEGYLYLTDRIKDMIVSGGENIYPAEVEQVLRLHPAIRDLVIVGIPDKPWGESVAAIIEWNEGCAATVEELRTFARKHIAGYKLPKLLQAVTALPRTATGKLQRAEVRRRIKSGDIPLAGTPT